MKNMLLSNDQLSVQVQMTGPLTPWLNCLELPEQDNYQKYLLQLSKLLVTNLRPLVNSQEIMLALSSRFPMFIICRRLYC
jgi:hypothetical protein